MIALCVQLKNSITIMVLDHSTLGKQISTGHNCNNQNVTVVPPTAASTPTPSTLKSEPHGNSCCNMSKTRARTKPEFFTCLLIMAELLAREASAAEHHG